jgi:long-chain acyl-CoA synthetase
MTFDEAIETLTGPGGGFELVDAEVMGRTTKVFANTPPSLRAFWDVLRFRPADDVLLVFEDDRITIGELLAQIDGLASALVERHGVAKGDRVGIAMRNYPEWIEAYAAVTSIGAIAVCFNAWWTTEELAYGIEDSGTRVLIADEERLERLAPLRESHPVSVISVRTDAAIDGVDRWQEVVVPAAMPPADIAADDDAMILYTSGTTGHPKGVVSTHRAVLTALMAYGCRSFSMAMTRSDDEVKRAETAGNNPTSMILTVPLFHVTGLVPVMLGSMLGGYKLVMMYKWSPERALQLIERERVTTFVGVPTMAHDLLECPSFSSYDTSSLTSVSGGGAPAPPELVRRIDRSFAAGRPSIGYGMTETNAYGPQNLGDDYLRKPSSSGRVVPVMEVAIFDPAGNRLGAGEQGEICFRGANLFRGYWNKPEATAEAIDSDGWLHTGDLGRLDEEGFVFVEDRAKDIVIRAGENIGTAEVEGVLYEHPAVYEVAVYGIPHDRLGEELVASVVVRDGVDVTADELQAHVGEHLASFKVPSRIDLRRQQLPRGATGKILKRQLRDEILDAD